MRRVHALDALRGLAVVAMALVHAVWFGHSSELIPAAWDWTQTTLFTFTRVAIHGKVTALFALVFGYSMALQWRSRAARGAPLGPFFRHRALLLVGIGGVHGAFWEGDILLVYGLSALLLVELARRGLRAVGIAAGLSWIGALWLGGRLATSVVWSAWEPWNLDGLVLVVVRVVVLFRDVTSPVNLYVLAALLLGYVLGAARLHERARLRTVVVAVAAPVTVVGVAWGVSAQLAGDAVGAWWAYLVSAVPGGLLYLAVGLQALTRPPKWLQDYGRLALTNYLTQTAVFLAVFRGLEAQGTTGPWVAAALAAALVGGQAAWTRRRLRTAGAGPVESWMRQRLEPATSDVEAELVAFARGDRF